MVLVSKEKERAMNLRISFAVEKNDMVEVLFGMFQSSIYEGIDQNFEVGKEGGKYL